MNCVLWIDLLVMETTDLSGMTLKFQSASAAPDTEYETYFDFSGQHHYHYPSGTLIRVYDEPEPQSDQAAVEHIHLYTGSLAARLPTDGIRIRLRDTNGATLHQRTTYGEETFEELDTTKVRNQDGSRLFLFFKNRRGNYYAPKDGRYRIDFSYTRDLGVGYPLLKRFGFSEPEQTVLEFSLPTVLPFASAEI